MKIKFANGNEITTSDRRNDIVSFLEKHIGPNVVIYAGLVWDQETALRYAQDDGQRAKARLYNDDGTEAVDFE